MIVASIHWIAVMIKSINPWKVLRTECSKHSVIASCHYFVLISQWTVFLLVQTLYLSHLLLYSQRQPTLSIHKECLLFALITPFLNDTALQSIEYLLCAGNCHYIMSHGPCKLVIIDIIVLPMSRVRFGEVNCFALGHTAITYIVEEVMEPSACRLWAHFSCSFLFPRLPLGATKEQWTSYKSCVNRSFWFHETEAKAK